MPPCANIHTMCNVPSHQKASSVEYEFLPHLAESVACTDSPVVPPCGHNDWDNQRVKRKVIMLKCRQCQKKWKTPLNNLRRCSRYLKDACNLGEDCKLLHIHKYKNPQKEADKRAKRCDERARIKMGRAKRAAGGACADGVPVLGDPCDDFELSLPNDAAAPPSSHESDTGSSATSAAASSTVLSADTTGASSSTLSLPNSQHIVANAAAQMAAAQQQQQQPQQFFLPSQGAAAAQGAATQVMLPMGMGMPMGFPQVSMLQGIPMLLPATNANGFPTAPAVPSMDMYTQAALQTQMLASMCRVTTGYTDLVQPATVALNNAPMVVIQNPVQVQTIGNLL